MTEEQKKAIRAAIEYAFSTLSTEEIMQLVREPFLEFRKGA